MTADNYYLPLLGDVIAERGFTQMYIASRLAMHPASIMLWANGNQAVPAYRVPMLADILDLLPDELVKRSGGAGYELEPEPTPVIERAAPKRPRIYHGFDGMPMIVPR